MYDLDETPKIFGRPLFYRLDENHEIQPATRRQVAEQWEQPERRVVGSDRINGWHVSTVFLVTRATMDDLLFETAVFDPNDKMVYLKRYSSWDAAAAGHAEAVADTRQRRPWPQRAWTIGQGGMDHLSKSCPRLKKSVAYRHSRAESPARRICAWCYVHPEHWDE